MSTTQPPFRILVGTDGSRPASLALDAVLDFPWPEPSVAYGVVARAGVEIADPAFRAPLEKAAESVAARAKERLAARWPGATVEVREGSADQVILAAAERLGAAVIAVGWSGSGPVRRLLAGSVSRAVARRAHCPVLVVRRAAKDFRRVLIGYDGSAHSNAAVEFVSTLRPGRGARVRLFTAAEAVQLPSHPLLPGGLRRDLASEVSRINKERLAVTRAKLERPAAMLNEAGWKVQTAVLPGAPLRLLLDEIGNWKADVLVLGATGAAGLDRVLLGSVAEGALNRCPVPVLIAR